MASSRSQIGRLLALLAIAVLAQTHVASWAIGAGQGRNLSQCVQGCNVLRDACSGQCAFDCVIFGSPGDLAYDACVSTCEVDCIVEMQECKKKCNVVHNPPSPSEP